MLHDAPAVRVSVSKWQQGNDNHDNDNESRFTQKLPSFLGTVLS